MDFYLGLICACWVVMAIASVVAAGALTYSTLIAAREFNIIYEDGK